ARGGLPGWERAGTGSGRPALRCSHRPRLQSLRLRRSRSWGAGPGRPPARSGRDGRPQPCREDGPADHRS
ncbi:MAG: hypothetical protein AVDCRST_MAG59-2049, partial [uncultured Thermomicrobiales bacterium]